MKLAETKSNISGENETTFLAGTIGISIGVGLAYIIFSFIKALINLAN